MKTTLLTTTAIFLMILAFSFKFEFAPKKGFKKVELDQSIKIINLTSYRYLDTIASVAAKSLRVKDVTIIITDIPGEYLYENALLAYTEKIDDIYYIRMRYDYGVYLGCLISCHEMIHLSQMYFGRLFITNDGFIFDNEFIPFTSNYEDRKFEAEAFMYEMSLKYEVDSILSHDY